MFDLQQKIALIVMLKKRKFTPKIEFIGQRIYNH
jgi:hypothetical protein